MTAARASRARNRGRIVPNRRVTADRRESGTYGPRVHQPSDRLATCGGLGAILLWSTTFAFARSLSEHIGPLTAGALVYLIGGGACLWRPRIPAGGFLRLPRRYLLGCGSLFVFYTAAIYLAVGRATDRGQLLEIALVNYLWPVLTVLFSLPLLGKRGSPWLLPGTALALAGMFLVITQGGEVSWRSFCGHLQENPAAYLLAFAAAVAWALYSNLARRWSPPASHGAVPVFLVVSGVVLLGLRLLTTEPSDWSARPVAEVLGLAAATAVAYVLWERAMRRGNLLLVVALSYLTPLFSTAVSCAYLKTSPAPSLWIGCFLLVCGSLITWRSVGAKQPG